MAYADQGKGSQSTLRHKSRPSFDFDHSSTLRRLRGEGEEDGVCDGRRRRSRGNGTLEDIERGRMWRERAKENARSGRETRDSSFF